MKKPMISNLLSQQSNSIEPLMNSFMFIMKTFGVITLFCALVSLTTSDGPTIGFTIIIGYLFVLPAVVLFYEVSSAIKRRRNR